MSAAFDAWVAKARAVPIECEIERRAIKLNGNGRERVGPCPKCGGDDRFSINTAKGVWNCRGCDDGGDVIALVEHLDGADFIAACTTLAGEPPPKTNGAAEAKKIVVARFDYLGEAGTLLFQVERVEYRNVDGSFVLKDGKRKKSFRQRRPDPDRPGEWLWNVDGVPVVPYRLPELIEAIAAGHPIVITEGEAKADLLWSWSIPATCCAGGAGKWKAEHSEFLRGADVVLIPDADEPGWKHANEIGAALNDIAARVRVLVLPGLPPKGDIIDWAIAGGTREQFDALIEQAPEWRPPEASVDNEEEKAKAATDEQQLLDELARLSTLDYDRRRDEAAGLMGVRRGTLDDVVQARRAKRAGEAGPPPLFGHWVVEPWPELVDGDSLLRDIIQRLRRHVVCSLEDATAIALWVMLAWVHEGVAIHSPILNINSAEPESGKSTTLGLISFLAPRCVSSVEISEAALYRAIKLWQPSFAIDEFDSVLASDDKVALRSVINSGHTRNTGVIRCVGDDKTPELFSTFCPKALGMCGKNLPAATLGRCVFVELRRKKADEKIERFKHKDDPGLADLRRRLLRWSLDNEDTLRIAAPAMPDGFDNRRADNWRIMLAIADLCSGAEDWGDKARAAAVKIEGKADNCTTGVRLLADIKALFDADPAAHCMHSATIVAGLGEDPEKPWAEFTRGKPLTQNRLAKLLGAYKIVSQTVTPPGLKDAKGYYRSQFEDAWSYYLTYPA